MNASAVDITQFQKCPCEADVLISHLSRFPTAMQHLLGHCDLQNVDVLSVIPLRDGRIRSELSYGQSYLQLDPGQSVLQNIYSYNFDPYVEYSRNVFKNRTCLFPFLDGTFALGHSNPTAGNFTCSSEVCKESVALIKMRELAQLEKLRENYPMCDKIEINVLMKLGL
jgi:hypothetical protein